MISSLLLNQKHLKPACPNFGCTLTRKNGTYRRTVQDLPFLGTKRTILKIYAHQYECLAPNELCSTRIFTPRFVIIAQHRQLTKRLEEAISIDSLKKGTFISVADKYRVDSATVRSIFTANIRKLDKEVLYETPEYIGLDEAHLNGVMRLVLVDTSASPAKLIDMIQDRKLPYVMAALNRFDNPSGIETVTIDMWEGYRAAVQHCLPRARIIVDRFHVMAHLHDTVEAARKQLYAARKANIEALPEEERIISEGGFEKGRNESFLVQIE